MESVSCFVRVVVGSLRDHTAHMNSLVFQTALSSCDCSLTAVCADARLCEQLLPATATLQDLTHCPERSDRRNRRPHRAKTLAPRAHRRGNHFSSVHPTRPALFWQQNGAANAGPARLLPPLLDTSAAAWKRIAIRIEPCRAQGRVVRRAPPASCGSAGCSAAGSRRHQHGRALRRRERAALVGPPHCVLLRHPHRGAVRHAIHVGQPAVARRH